MSVPLENHLVQCFQNISKKYLKQYENSFFVPLTSSVHIDLNKLADPQNLVFNLNQIPPPNLISLPQIQLGQIEDKVEQLLDNCEYQGMNDSLLSQNQQAEILKVFQDFQFKIEKIQKEIFSIEKKLEKLDRDDDQYLEEINNKKQLHDELKKANESKQIFISSNLQTIVNQAKNIFEKQYELNQEKAFLISIVNSFKQQINGPQSLFFSKFFYDSSQENLEPFPQESREQKLCEVLSKLGLGQQTEQTKLPNSIQDIFENIIIQCETAPVFFERKWLPIDILQNENIGIKKTEINQWSNGKQFQQASESEFPYMIVGAVICKNIKVEGFKTDRLSSKKMMRIQSDGDQSNVLIFKLKSNKEEIDAYTIQVDPHIITIKSPNIIGFILQPLIPFPKTVYIDKVFPVQKLKIDIKDFIEQDNSHDDIINSFEDDPEINIFKNWRQKIQNLIDEIQAPITKQVPEITEEIQEDPSLTIDLPKISEFQHKQNLIKRLKDQNSLNTDKARNDAQLKMAYKGLQGNEAKSYIQFFEKYRIVTNKLDSVFQIEKEEFKKIVTLKRQNNEHIDFEELSLQLLIHRQVIEELYEDMFEPLPLQIHPLIEEKRSEIIDFLVNNSEEEIYDFYKNEKSISIISKWKEQIKSIISESQDQSVPQQIEPTVQVSIEELFELKKDEIQSYIESDYSNEIIIDCLSNDQELTKFQSWEDQVIEFINKIKENLEPIIPGMKENLPNIQEYDQKQRLIDHFRNNKYQNFKCHELAKLKLFGVQGENYMAYVNYFVEFRCITNKIEQIFNQEKVILDKFVQNEINLKQISEQTLIHPQVLKTYYGIQDEINIDDIEEYIVKQKDQIQQYLDQTLQKNDIIDIYEKEDNQMKRIFKWKPKLQFVIDKIIQENSIPDKLPDFENYEQKSVLVERISSNEIQKDLSKNEQEIKLIYKGLNKETVKKCFVYFQIKQNTLSNSINEVMDEEIDLCNQEFLKLFGKPIDIEQLYQETLIDQKIILEILDKYNSKPIKIPDLIEELREEINDYHIEGGMNLAEMINHYKDTRKDIQKIKNWEVFINIIMDSLKKVEEPVENPKPKEDDDQFEFFEEPIQKNQEINLPQINYYQKLFIIESFLKQGEKAFRKNHKIPDQMLQSKYCSLTNEQIQAYLEIYEKYKLVTLNIQDLLPEEKNQIIEEFKLQQNVNIKCLSSKYLIDEQIIEQIYKQDFFDQELINIFIKATGKDEQQVKEILQKYHSQAKNILVDLFKTKTELYLEVKDICVSKRFCTYLMDNIIEEHLEILKSDDLHEMRRQLRELSDDDPILLMKILRSLEGQSADESEAENDEDPLRIKEKSTKILKTNKSQDLLTVYSKAAYNSNYENIEDAS